MSDAVDRELISKNPFKSVKAPRPKKKVNSFVDRSTIAHIMAKADNRWKVIIGLCRYAGLRNPSETLSLKWSHIEGREIRECPIFPDVLKILEYAYELYLSRDNPSEYVCDADSYRAAAQTAEGWKNSNLRTQFLKLLKKAGVEPWPRVFHSMRASLQTEFEENSLGTSFVVGWAIPKKWPKHTICLSLPNTSKRPPSLR